MDPLSITASASALATFAGRAAFALHAGIEAVKHADQTLLQCVFLPSSLSLAVYLQ